ncbi:hypothetical protein Rhopal_003856-T1 [Rhodotorula paludigena]|uniref:Uncharacterized protein n=1 Tax=Rhodotorula paludigena TaxID=86838 RepID=A0AAV5GMX7_9BASI|nr:hypothetical protein Rhopal_003856-T1 [Rhodotorula paludigena]
MTKKLRHDRLGLRQAKKAMTPAGTPPRSGTQARPSRRASSSELSLAAPSPSKDVFPISPKMRSAAEETASSQPA